MAEAPAECPVRPGEPCMLCQPGGPDNCGLVYLVMSDPELRQELRRLRRTGDATEEADPAAPR